MAFVEAKQKFAGKGWWAAVLLLRPWEAAVWLMLLSPMSPSLGHPPPLLQPPRRHGEALGCPVEGRMSLSKGRGTKWSAANCVLASQKGKSTATRCRAVPCTALQPQAEWCTVSWVGFKHLSSPPRGHLMSQNPEKPGHASSESGGHGNHGLPQ